jgi:putative transposase
MAAVVPAPVPVPAAPAPVQEEAGDLPNSDIRDVGLREWTPTSPTSDTGDVNPEAFLWQIDMNEMVFKPGHHSPPHLFMADWFYMLTGSIYKQQPLIKSSNRKKEFLESLHAASEIHHWLLVAWVVMDDHYHVILKSPQVSPDNLTKFVASYHKYTAHLWNNQDGLPGRKVWWNYWDTCIRSDEDYRNRLRYVFWNPVKHGMAGHPGEYPFCNYADFLEHEWFEMGMAPAEVNDVPEF